MDKRPIKFLILVLLLLSVVAILFALNPRVKTAQAPTYVPPIVKADPNREIAVESGDGKLILKMKEEKGKEGMTYIFWVADTSAGTQKELYRKTVPLGTTMAIPLNTFSPDNKYMFLQEVSGESLSYFAGSAAGIPFADGSQFLEFSSMFKAKYPNYKITEATGWGGVGLIIVNTKSGGSQGPSFWFDVGSKSFIQLSNHFN